MLLRILIALAISLGTGLALFEWPYAYYELLRLFVCGEAIFLAYTESQTQGRTPFVVGFSATALLFNPLIPLSLGREAWIVIDLIACLGFLGIALDLIIRARSHFDATDALSRWFEEGRTSAALQAEVLRQAALAEQQARTEALAEARQKKLDRLVQFAIANGAQSERPDREEVATALSEAALSKLTAIRETVSERTGAPAPSVLAEDILLLIVTDAVSARLGVDWEAFSLILHAGRTLKLGDDLESIDYEDPGERFRTALDAHLQLIQKPSAHASMQRIGEAVLRWMSQEDEEPFFEAASSWRELERHL